MQAIDVINPATGKLLKSYPLMSKETVATIIEDMAEAQQQWQQTAFAKRSECMHKAAKIMREDIDHYAMIITNEMGKPITQARAEIEKCAVLCEYYANHGEEHLKAQAIKTERTKSYRCFEPLGIIFAIMPWNFPMWQALRFAVPNLIAGNAGLLKHAPNSTGAALAIEEIFAKAGFPKDLFRSLIIDVDLSPFIINHPKIAGVTLTGSNRAGAAVGAEAGKAMKKVVLELGGSDPYLILEDADLDLAAEQCAKSRLSNAGQICISAKRIIVVDAVREAFVEKLLNQIQIYHCGDPTLPETTMGPMAREDLLLELYSQVKASIATGAKCIQGGKPEDRPGFYFPPTVLLDVKKGTPAYDQELFGPVVCVIAARNEAEAIRIANDTPFGLGAAVFTQDTAKGERIAREQLRAGTCNVNTLVGSDPRLPFGGIKQSGYGRELAVEGLREFMNIKTVVVA